MSRKTPRAIHPVHPADGKCGAKTKASRRCSHPAGFRTPHPGAGRCYLHGGMTPVKHGRYSSVARDSVAERLALLDAESEAEKLNTMAEATLIRALAADFVERYQARVNALMAWNDDERDEAVLANRPPRPQRLPELREVAELLDRATVVVDRIHKQRSANAISLPDFLRLMTEMGRIVKQHVHDEEALDRIERDWRSLRLF